ncbi:M23 family metallopeptidase [Conexibacter sp. JD483]|uniref:M23 family metallopeptidase n=1 Tax=unclassified Conexibacter TaxID=2627773 RepID=UPI00271C7EE9|nr:MULTISPECIES: M23 family metallopeptidase [unclassified Conexibacter]MDO8187501.1 M23 family metallopeptidase [Conexibacter sp. CPCC 205706]MDO8199256.1 M23 family metallopeptidase [Conexibacter sp. CPCC 205762]MDR9369539.1 M23 family metallopeptidase [Conexibacter sp. JD483]
MTTSFAAVLGLGALALPSAALAEAGGASINQTASAPADAPASSPSAPSAADGGQPSLSGLVCKTGCPAPGTVERGGTLTLQGQALDAARTVVFLGGRGSRDDARVRVSSKSATKLDVTVPAAAVSGQVVVETSAGTAMRSSARLSVKVVKAATALSATLPAPKLAAVAGIADLDAGISTRKAGKGVSAVQVAFVSQAPGTVGVRVDVVRAADGISVFSDTRSAAPGKQQTLTWEGRNSGADFAADGRYELRLSAGTEVSTRTASSEIAAGGGASIEGGSPAPDGAVKLGAFTFVGAVFPVRGTHDYGQGAAAFGAGRDGHSHEGQDVMAQCGTPVVAAQGGVIKNKAYQSNAGNYVVIGGTASGEDHMYAHFRAPAVVARGQRVQTGQVLGYVGDTGSASACHLHFEIWTAPGWYSGGRPVNPVATLRAWDRLG